MMSPGPLLLCLLPFSLLAQNNCPNNLCEEKIKFWLTTAKNDEKNQWIAKTGFEHSKESTREWRLQIESNCAEEEVEDVFRVAATITASCPTRFDKREVLPQILNDDGYTSFATGRYKFYLNETKWFDAKRICELDGAHLAIIDSKEESKILIDIAKCGHWTPWIGVYDKKQNNVYVDVFGNPITDFWGVGEPNHLRGDCVRLVIPGLMSTGNCIEKIHFICEKF